MIVYVLALATIAYIALFMYKTKTGSPYVASKDAHIRRLMKYIKRGMRVADLGCGDGRVLIEAVKHGAKQAEGWEIEPHVWLLAKQEVRKEKLDDRVKVYFGDMWKADLSVYDLVFVYQLTRYSERFRKKCETEMKRGSLVVANTYPIEGLTLLKKDQELFVYQI